MAEQMQSLEKAEKVLDYWYAIEFLAQDKFDNMWEIRSKFLKAQEDFAKGKTIGSYRELQQIKTELGNRKPMYLGKIKSFTQDNSVDAGKLLGTEFIDHLLSGDIREFTDAQVANPWFTKCYNIECEKLFYYAMRLNKEFVLSSKSCRDNFKTLGQYWGMLLGDEK